MPMRNPHWNREDHILAFNLYCQLPFGKMHARNPKIVHLARLLGRSASAVAYKLCNFARLDPALQARGVKGMSHGAKGEEEIWEEFSAHPEALIFESQKLLAKAQNQSVEAAAEIETSDLPPDGLEREALVRLRVNQGFFRRRVVSAYEFRCCVTGLETPDLLVASHIVPWSVDSRERLNPRNGLCLNALHDRAFDRGLMWVDDDRRVRFHPRLRATSRDRSEGLHWVVSFEGSALRLPNRFEPDPVLLHRHAEWARGAVAE